MLGGLGKSKFGGLDIKRIYFGWAHTTADLIGLGKY